MRRFTTGMSAIVIGLMLSGAATAGNADSAMSASVAPAQTTKLKSVRDFKGRFVYRVVRVKTAAAN